MSAAQAVIFSYVCRCSFFPVVASLVDTPQSAVHIQGDKKKPATQPPPIKLQVGDTVRISVQKGAHNAKYNGEIGTIMELKPKKEKAKVMIVSGKDSPKEKDFSLTQLIAVVKPAVADAAASGEQPASNAAASGEQPALPAIAKDEKVADVAPCGAKRSLEEDESKQERAQKAAKLFGALED